MNDSDEKKVIIACGIFEREIDELIRRGRVSGTCRYLDSMLHMAPAQLERQLQKCLDEFSDCQIALVYGDCQHRMFEMEREKNICRTAGVNCCELILGKEKYRELRSESVFFLLPEWTERWKEVFQESLGFDADTAKNFMGEMHSKLLYLDTGIVPVPIEKLERAAEFCGLPYEVMPVELDQLETTINLALGKLGAGENGIKSK